MRKSKKVTRVKPARKVIKRTAKKATTRKVITRKKRVALSVRFPVVKKSKYTVGDRVYSIQNPTVKLPIAEVKAQTKGGIPSNKYRILHGMKDGKPIYGNWLSESSIFTIKKRSK